MARCTPVLSKYACHCDVPKPTGHSLLGVQTLTLSQPYLILLPSCRASGNSTPAGLSKPPLGVEGTSFMVDSNTHPTLSTRREMLRLFAGGAAALGGAAVFGWRDASAARVWCQKDPAFLINGRLLHVYVSGSNQLDEAVTGPTEVVLEIPYQGVEANFIWADEGFGGLGYDVRIVAVDWLEVDPSGAIPFAVKTFVSANEDMAIQVEAVTSTRMAISRGKISGWAGRTAPSS